MFGDLSLGRKLSFVVINATYPSAAIAGFQFRELTFPWFRQFNQRSIVVYVSRCNQDVKTSALFNVSWQVSF